MMPRYSARCVRPNHGAEKMMSSFNVAPYVLLLQTMHFTKIHYMPRSASFELASVLSLKHAFYVYRRNLLLEYESTLQ